MRGSMCLFFRGYMNGPCTLFFLPTTQLHHRPTRDFGHIPAWLGYVLSVFFPTAVFSRPAELSKVSPNPPFVHDLLIQHFSLSHPAILMPPSAIFYNDSLVPCAVNGSVSWSGLPNPRLPLLLIGNESKEECVDEVYSFYALYFSTT